MGLEVGWHLRFSREDELRFLVRADLAPNVEDAVFIAGGWRLAWLPDETDGGFACAVATRVRSGE